MSSIEQLVRRESVSSGTISGSIDSGLTVDLAVPVSS
jgi:hypothetical protein